MNKARLFLEPISKHGSTLRLGAGLLHPNGAKELLWWEVPEAWGESLTPWADPWVIGFLFPMMQAGVPVHVEGRVSPSLLANLELFMRIWACWAPDKYRPVALSADNEIELPPVSDPGLTIASFSCGADSSFTLYRHARALAGRRTQRLGAAVVQHGLDVWLGRANSNGVYAKLLHGATTMLSSIGVPCIPMRTNFQQMRLEWAEAWGTQLISGLYLWAGRYDTALIANEVPYQWLGVPWACHPVTNPLLGSRGFTVHDDGGDFSRAEKAKAIAAWPEAMHNLHVCFGVENPAQYENCCECEKCIRTILSFRIAGCPKPDAFKRDPTDAQIRRVRLQIVTKIYRWEQLAAGAEAAGMGHTSWAKAIRAVLRKHRWREFRNRLQQPFVPLRNKVRKLRRGSELSRSEIARHLKRNYPAKLS